MDQDQNQHDPNVDPNNAAGHLPPAPPPAQPVPNQVAAVDVVTLKSHFKIPEYSGLAKGTSFVGATGTRTELLSVQSFVQQVNNIQGAAKWDDEVTAQYVKLSFLPETPIHDYAINEKDADFMSKWSLMAPRLLKEFATFVSVSDKVHIFRQFKQKPTELAQPYLYRITREYNRFLEDLEVLMTATGQPWAGQQPGEAAYKSRQEIMKFVTDFHLMNFFALGLRSTTLEDVTRSGKTDLSGMLKEAMRSEQAQQQSQRRATIGELSLDDHPTPTPGTSTATSAENPTISEDLIISAIRKFTQKRSTRPSNNTAGGNKSVSCFYCGIARHKANECRKRIKDRSANIWRQKIHDAPMNKADWDKAVRSANDTKVSTITATSERDAENAFYNFFAKN